MASDISTQVLAKAQQALYPIAQIENIPQAYLSRFCLKGTGSQAGLFLIERGLREGQFFHANLNTALPRVGEFDVIFLRNVMIYFDTETKRQVVRRLLAMLKRGGYFLIGHSESLNGINDELQLVAPSIFANPEVYDASNRFQYCADAGRYIFGDSHTRVRTLLGSCVAIVVWHPQRKIGGMCHYVLPNRKAVAGRPLDGRYANEAMEIFA